MADFNLSTQKLTILFEEGRHKLLYGGRFSSKSHSAFRVAVGMSDSLPILILCTREVQKSIRDSSYRLIVNVINEMGLADRFTILKNEIRNLHTGATFLFCGLHDTHNLKSMEGVDLCIVEEARTISQESLEILIPTIRKDGSQIWWLWNPESEDDPIEMYFHSKTGIKPPNVLEAEINYPDNPFLSTAAIQEAEYMRDTNFELYEHIYLGKYRKVGMAWDFINPEWVNDAIEGRSIAKVSGLAGGWHSLGVDYASSGVDLTVMIWATGNHVDGLFEEPYSACPSTSARIFNKLLELGRYNTTIGVDCNGVGSGIGDTLRDSYKVETNLDRCTYKEKEYQSPIPVSFKFDCWRSQAWWQLRCDLELGNIDLSALKTWENLWKLKKEIMAHHMWIQGEHLRITSKKDMRKADVLGWSPNYADALVIWNWVRKRKISENTTYSVHGVDYGLEDNDDDDRLASIV
jgi:hypothetical protein